MTAVLQLRRGTAAETAAFTGANGEVTYDTTDKRAVMHDGSTAGGIPLAKESEIPAALNAAFTAASASSAAALAFHEDTDNGTNKVTVQGPASVASDKVATLQDVTGTIYVSGGTDVAIADGGTGASDAATAFANLKQAASDSASGAVELATAAETTTGTDAARAVTPDGLAGSDYGKTVVTILVFDDSQDVSVADGAGDVFWRVPAVCNGYNLVAVAAAVQTAGTTGTTDIQIHNVTQAADMLTTKITIDSGETDSSTAAAAAVIDTGNDDVATGDRIRIDVDATATTKAKGLLVELTFQLP